MDSFADRMIWQTREWMDFIAKTQNASPVWGEVRDGTSVVGYFSGLIVTRWGVKVLGSPFPGWTTSYMGFNLAPETPRWMALQALERFAFREVGCLHFEILDRELAVQDGEKLGLDFGWATTYETDLTQSEDEIFKAMTSACRRCIRKAEKSGLIIEEASDIEFADEYYAQLLQVFGRQGLIPRYDRDRVAALIRHIHPTGRLLLLRARDPEGNCIATGIYPGMNTTVLFWGNASTPSGLHLRPNEALHWFAMRYWKQKGVKVFNWGGGGSYKEKYGCTPLAVPWFRKSRFAVLQTLRTEAERMIELRRRAGAWVRQKTSPQPSPAEQA